MATYSRRFTRKRSSVFSPEFMCLLVLVAASVTTVWYAGHKLVVNLSIVETAANFLGMTQAPAATRQVGYSPAREQEAEVQAPAATAATGAPYCPAGETPAFANGIGALKQQLGGAMGTPVECEHAASVRGDTIQQTSTGLAAYNGTTNIVTFTNGWRHWALTADGLVTWDGTEADPPERAAPPGEAGAPSDEDQ